MGSADRYNFKREWWLSGGIIFAALALTAGALYFLSGDIASQSSKIASARASIASETEALGEFASLKSEAAQAVPYTAAMEQLVPTHDTLIGFQGWLTGKGDSNNLSVSVAFTGTNSPASASSPGSDGFSLRASGALKDIVAFLGDIETKSQHYLVDISSFDMVNNGTSYSLTAQGEVFSRASAKQ